jgi:hypothetical protein
MTKVRKFGMALAVAALLASSGGVPTVQAASAPPQTNISISEFCNALARFITYLESLPPSPLRDFLLARARALQQRYCS